jgi:hypothetical protein
MPYVYKRAAGTFGVSADSRIGGSISPGHSGTLQNANITIPDVKAYSTWFLPFIALVSQLPFSADSCVSGSTTTTRHIFSYRYQFENAISILLNMGSPTMAAYSVTLTTLNSRWIYRRFKRLSYPNARSAARVLNNLQQSPLEVTQDDYILSSLVVLPENDQWWSDLLILLDLRHTYTWSLSNISSTIWVIVAFSLTGIDAFTSRLCSC